MLLLDLEATLNFSKVVVIFSVLLYFLRYKVLVLILALSLSSLEYASVSVGADGTSARGLRTRVGRSLGLLMKLFAGEEK